MNLATLNPAQARFSVPLRNARTGERRRTVVTLPRPTQLEVLEIIAHRGIGGSAWPRANLRATQRAERLCAGWQWDGGRIEHSAPPMLTIVSNAERWHGSPVAVPRVARSRPRAASKRRGGS